MLEDERSAVRFGDPARNRQAETGPIRPPHPDEPVEHPALLIRRNTITVVGDPQRDLRARAFEAGRHFPARCRVADGVVQQVPYHLSQQHVITGEADFLFPTRQNIDRTLGGQHPHRPSGFDHQIIQIQELRPEGNTLSFGTREQKHGLHQLGQTRRLLGNDGQRFAVILVRSHALRQRHLRRGSDDRDRRSQLVGGVGHELALEVQGSGKAVEQLVE